jgi:hypothetical protein
MYQCSPRGQWSGFKLTLEHSAMMGLAFALCVRVAIHHLGQLLEMVGTHVEVAQMAVDQ